MVVAALVAADVIAALPVLWAVLKALLGSIVDPVIFAFGSADYRRFLDAWLMIIGTAAIIYVAVRTTRAAIRWASNNSENLERSIADALRPVVRDAINAYANSKYPDLLLVENAPGLAEASDPDRLVDRLQFHQIEAMMERLGANTIAVADLAVLVKRRCLGT